MKMSGLKTNFSQKGPNYSFQGIIDRLDLYNDSQIRCMGLAGSSYLIFYKIRYKNIERKNEYLCFNKNNELARFISSDSLIESIPHNRLKMDTLIPIGNNRSMVFPKDSWIIKFHENGIPQSAWLSRITEITIQGQKLLIMGSIQFHENGIPEHVELKDLMRLCNQKKCDVAYIGHTYFDKNEMVTHPPLN